MQVQALITTLLPDGCVKRARRAGSLMANAAAGVEAAGLAALQSLATCGCAGRHRVSALLPFADISFLFVFFIEGTESLLPTWAVCDSLNS